jgi:ribonuclease BN (tRNA processing enzyme)
VFLTHLHADHTGDLVGLILYPWGVREDAAGPLPPLRVYGPSRPEVLPEGDAIFHRETTIHPERPAPSASDILVHQVADLGYLARPGIAGAELARMAALGFSGTVTAGRDGLRRVLPRSSAIPGPVKPGHSSGE